MYAVFVLRTVKLLGSAVNVSVTLLPFVPVPLVVYVPAAVPSDVYPLDFWKSVPENVPLENVGYILYLLELELDLA